MLLTFRAENVRSFRDAFELSLLATSLAEPGVPRPVPWRAGGRPVQVLPAAGVFGANASGKTNVLRALDDMRALVLQSFRQGDPRGGMPRNAFRLSPSTAGEPSRFEVDLVLAGIRHEYGFLISDERVEEEWAYRYPHGKAALLFRRTADAVALGEQNRVKGRAVTEILRPNSLYLSAAAAASHPDLLPLQQWFERNLVLAEASSDGRSPPSSCARRTVASRSLPCYAPPTLALPMPGSATMRPTARSRTPASTNRG